MVLRPPTKWIGRKGVEERGEEPLEPREKREPPTCRSLMQDTLFLRSMLQYNPRVKRSTPFSSARVYDRD